MSDVHPNDWDLLLVQAQAGDRIALASFIRSSQSEVWRFAAHLVDRDEADDLTQEVYLRAYRALPAFRGDSSARTWLLAIARRTCMDSLRRHTRRRALTRRIVAERSPTADSQLGATVELDGLLAALEPDRRDAFVLTQVLGYSYGEAATICGVPVGTIRSRVARARESLIAAWTAVG